MKTKEMKKAHQNKNSYRREKGSSISPLIVRQGSPPNTKWFYALLSTLNIVYNIRCTPNNHPS